MYDYIKGIFKGIIKEYIVIENSGIGYKVFTSGNTMSQMPKKDEEVLLYLIQIVREDFIGLYGFLTRDELDMFNKLLTISGVGPKAALSLLSITSVDNLKYAIISEEDKILTKAPGIGSKTAQRIILELKDKIDLPEMKTQDGIEIANNEVNNKNDFDKKVNETLCALISLGYSEKEANKVIKSVDLNDSLENIIKCSLKLLMN